MLTFPECKWLEVPFEVEIILILPKKPLDQLMTQQFLKHGEQKSPKNLQSFYPSFQTRNLQIVQLKEFPTMSRSNPSKTQAKQGLARSKSSLTKGSPNPRANSCDFGARCVMSRVMDKWNSDFWGTFGPEDIMVRVFTQFPAVASNAADFATFDAALFNLLLEGES